MSEPARCCCVFGWISCDAELPPVSEEVLFVEVDYAGSYVRLGWRGGDDKWHTEAEGSDPLPTSLDPESRNPESRCGVSHWMYLPELPTEAPR